MKDQFEIYALMGITYGDKWIESVHTSKIDAETALENYENDEYTIYLIVEVPFEV